MILKPLQTTLEDLAIQRPWLVWVEVVVITLVLPVVGWWRQPQDPFFLQAHFPWLVLAPLLLGLRYGFIQALGSVAVMSVLMSLALHWGYLGVASFPGSLTLGLLLVGMLAGEFCDMWHRRLHRLSEINSYQHTLVQKFTRSYHLLALSHGQLERRMLANTRSLRETMTYLRQRAQAVDTDASDDHELHHLMMEVLSSFGSVQVAALYRVDEYGILIPNIVARLGNPEPIRIGDPMVVQAMQEKRLICIRPHETVLAAPSSAKVEVGTTAGAPLHSKMLLAVLPLTDVWSRTWGVVTIQALPFEALNRDHLALLAVLGGQMGDLLALGAAGSMVQFHACLLRSQHDARCFNLPAMLIGIAVDQNLSPPSLFSEILDQHRGLDQQWLMHNAQGHRVLLTVLPLTDAEASRGFVQRLEVWCQTTYGKPLADCGVRVRQVALDGEGAAQDKLRTLQKACDIHAA
ncbi:MAG: hypothetical protein JNJ46_22485 [Myxococcales bacterium]|nr:hypothetical protein [Myxococcales bacterium]